MQQELFKTCGSFWQYYRDQTITNDAVDNNSLSFKDKITGQTGTTGVEIIRTLRYLSNIWEPLKFF